MSAALAENVGRAHAEAMRDGLLQLAARVGPLPGDHGRVYEFVLEHGQEFKGTRWTTFRGRGYHKMAKRFCFANAWEMSQVHPELTYFEGYAFGGIVAADHAWCVDEEGRVVDFTWRMHDDRAIPEREWDYFGVGFDSWALAEWWDAKEMASVLTELTLRGDATDFVVRV